MVVSLFLCMVECSLMGGALFGWGPILYTFEQQGIYEDLCTYKNITTVKGSDCPPVPIE